MNELKYISNSAGLDFGRYDLESPYAFREDRVTETGLEDIVWLSKSSDWQDRIRAAYLLCNRSVSLPDQFPCLYERADSPNQSGSLRPREIPWVKSPDIGMLRRLLPFYQELWDSYTGQWGPGARRVMEVGRLDGLSASGVCRPGTTPGQILDGTIRTHNMHRWAPNYIKKKALDSRKKTGVSG